MLSGAYGLDLGTANVRISTARHGILVNEASVAAFDREDGVLMACGTAARDMTGRAPGNIAAVAPLRGGCIADLSAASALLDSFFKRAASPRLIRPDIVAAVPSGITEVGEYALMEACKAAGARRVFLLEAPAAAAFGAKLDFNGPKGLMVVDIGAGSCDAAVLSLGSIVESESTEAGGSEYDAALIRYVRRRFNILIGRRTAEDIKLSIGAAVPRPEAVKISYQGRDLSTGYPKSFELTDRDTVRAYEPVTMRVLDAIENVLMRTPPELVADLGRLGITLTGGGSRLFGLPERISSRTSIPVRVADEPELCTALGVGLACKNINRMKSGSINISRRRELKTRVR